MKPTESNSHTPFKPPSAAVSAEMAGVSRNSLFVLISRGVELAAAYLIMIGVARYLSLESFGDYSYVTALVSAIMSLCYFGTQQVLVREVAQDRAAAPSLVGVALVLRLGLVCLAGMAVLVTIWVVGLRGELARAALVALAAEVCFIMGLLLRAVFQAFERMEYEPPVTAVFSLLWAGLIIAVIRLDLGLMGMFWAAFMAKAAMCAMAAFLAFTRLTRPSFKNLGARLRPFLRAALIIGLMVFLYQNIFKINVLLLKWLGDREQVALFQAPHTLALQLQVIPVSLATAVLPVFSRLVKGNREEMQTLFAKVARLSLVVSCWLSLNLSLFSPELIGAVLDRRYAGSAAVLSVVAWALVPLTLDMLLNNLLVATDNQRYGVYSAFLVLCLGVLTGIMIIPSHGHMGAAWIALGSYTLLAICCRLFVRKVGLHLVLGPLLLRVGLTCLAAGAVGWLLRGVNIWLALAGCQAVFLGLGLAIGAINLRELLNLRGMLSGRPPVPPPAGVKHP